MYISKKRGFTLIELLVVISIIALLVSILMPALNKAKQQAYQTVCLSNQKNLILAWVQYNDDNNDSIVMHYVSPDTMKGGSRDHGWVEPPQNEQTGAYLGGWNNLTNYEQSGGNGQRARKTGIRKGAMWKYISEEDVFHCQGDKRHKEGNADAQMFRTYGLPAGIGQAGNNNFRNEGGHNQSTYIKKASSIKFASEKFVFGEASYDDFLESKNYLDQYILNMGQYYSQLNVANGTLGVWIPNSIWHGNSTTFGFADGHADAHKWMTKEVIEHFKERKVQTLEVPNTNDDVRWLYMHYPNAQNF